MPRKNNARRKTRAVTRPWNKGLKVGKKDALTPDQVKRIRGVLMKRGKSGLRDFALFSTAIDTMLKGQDLLELMVRDVQDRNHSIRSIIKVSQKRGGPPVRCALSTLTAKTLEKWIASSGKRPGDYLFPGRGTKSRRPMTPRQLSRLVKLWVADAGFDAGSYGLDSLRRTKALHILKGTGDLQAVRALLGHATIEGTSRFLGLQTKSDPLALSRAFDI
ncbi:MAG TPA: tyrosine-type recombinase/integrase [Xanthobacteraceae bacterium]